MSYTRDARTKLVHGPTLGDASRRTRRSRRGGRSKESEESTMDRAAYMKESAIMGVAAQEALLQHIRPLPLHQGGDAHTKQSSAKATPASTHRHTHHAPAPAGGPQIQSQHDSRQHSSSQGQREAQPAAHEAQELVESTPWWDVETSTQIIPQEEYAWTPVILDTKNSKTAAVVSIVATCTASQVEAQRPPAIISPVSSEDISSPSQAVRETAPEEAEQRDNEDEAEAASRCEAEPQRPQAMEHRDQRALVIYQPPLQTQPPPAIINLPENTEDVMGPSQAVSETVLEEDELDRGIQDETAAASLPEAELEAPQATEQRDQRALIVYQPPLQAVSCAKVAATGNLPLPSLGGVMSISRSLLSFVDAVPLKGYTITPAKQQLLLTYPVPAKAPTPAPAASQDSVQEPTEEAEPAFNRLANAMDAAWFGQAAPLPPVQRKRHAEAAAASAQPSPQKEQGASEVEKRRGFLGFVKALLRPCFGRSS